MRVIIENHVHAVIQEFYESAMRHHITLDEETVRKKKIRLYEAMGELGKYATIYRARPFRLDWAMKNYQECICEDFHFAYTIEVLYTGETVVAIHDACHSLQNH